MEMSEFLNRTQDKGPVVRTPEEVPVEEELDVQKAVIESLAADKAEQDERIGLLTKENESLKFEISRLKSQISDYESKIGELKVALAKVGDVLAANAEGEASNKVALIDRDPELNDRFPGETRDHVMEVIKKTREEAEEHGRIRRPEILESVLVANVPLGNLTKKREALKKFFAENANILSGPVIAELEKCGISHKNGDQYLLPDEIIKRTY